MGRLVMQPLVAKEAQEVQVLAVEAVVVERQGEAVAMVALA